MHGDYDSEDEFDQEELFVPEISDLVDQDERVQAKQEVSDILDDAAEELGLLNMRQSHAVVSLTTAIGRAARSKDGLTTRDFWALWHKLGSAVRENH